MKKFFFLFVAFFVLSFFVSWQVDRINKISSNQIKRSDPMVIVDKNNGIEPPMLIIEDDLIESEKIKENVLSNIKPKPRKNLEAVTAESYLVGDLETGKIILSHNPLSVFPIASLSKFFTAIVAKKNIDKDNKIKITQSMIDTYGDAGNLVKDEKFTVEELLYPLLLESSNDAAEALAQYFGYKNFIGKMNSLAKGLGMSKTSFADSSGLSSANVSNVSDLFVLAKYYFNNEKEILEITKQKEKTMASTSDHAQHSFVSINPFVVYSPFIGGKTGRTKEAKESMISLFNIETGSTTRPLAVIILRSDLGEREMDTERILGIVMSKL